MKNERQVQADLKRLIIDIFGKDFETEDGVRFLFQNFGTLKGRIERKVGRTELRKRLAAVAAGAEKVMREMEDPVLLRRLIAEERSERGGYVGARQGIARRQALKDIARYAEAAAGKVPKGKGKKPAVMSAQELCARIVSDVWRSARGKRPGSQNQKAWDGCEALWNAADGRRSRSKGGPLGRWRGHLKRAETPPTAATPGAALFPGRNGRLAIVEVSLPAE